MARAQAATRRFDASGTTGDLAVALDAARAACASVDNWHLAGDLLIRLLRLRYERTGSVEDLDDAVQAGHTVFKVGRAVVGAAAEYARALMARHELTGDPADVEAAVDMGRRVVGSTGEHDAALPVRRSDLAAALRLRFLLTGAAEDLAEALDLSARAVVGAVGHSPATRAAASATSALVHRARFAHTGDPTDLDHAIGQGEDAERHGRAGAPGGAERKAELAAALLDRHRLTGSAADLDRAADLARLAVAATPPEHPALPRHLAGLGDVHHARFDRDHDPLILAEALDVRRRVVGLPCTPDRLRLATALDLARTATAAGHGDVTREAWDLVFRLDPGSDLASTAVAHLVAVGRPRDAVEFFQLSATPGEPLRPFGELARAAVGGPVVLINVDAWRCDALVVVGGDALVVPLPDLTERDAAEAAARLVDAAAEPELSRAWLPATLRWLWDVVGAPLFAAFRHVGGEPGVLPRVWWCLAGRYRFLPVHAAGTKDGPSVPKLVVSSHTRDLVALLHPPRPRAEPVVLLDREGSTPLADLVPADARVLAATATAEQLGRANWLHLTEPDVTFAFADLDLGALDFVFLSEHAAPPIAEGDDLAAVLHAAGRTQVVASRWAAPDVTPALYRALSASGVPDPTDTATALHAALADLRRTGHPADWAGYAHYGY
ncbi:hypothetical protein [Actinosynnema sp. NPDC020468]|uniref:hypothetical protein n=1 Tax=Actinosynnema sp. NPDC020468 TaxID=3154488 RepID=UPI0033E51AA0